MTTGLARHIVVRVQTEFLEFFVLTDQFRGFIRQQVQKMLKVSSAEGALEILNHVELDAALL